MNPIEFLTNWAAGAVLARKHRKTIARDTQMRRQAVEQAAYQAPERDVRAQQKAIARKVAKRRPIGSTENPWPNNLGGYVPPQRQTSTAPPKALGARQRFFRLAAAYLERAAAPFVQKPKTPQKNREFVFQEPGADSFSFLRFFAPTRSEARAALKWRLGLSTSRGY